MSAKLLLELVFTALCVSLVVGFETGPPAVQSTCLNMVPSSPAPHILQSGNGSYDLIVNIVNTTDGYFMFQSGMVVTGEYFFSHRMETITEGVTSWVYPSLRARPFTFFFMGGGRERVWSH